MQVDDFLRVGEVDDEAAVRLAQPLFDRRYRLPVPVFPHHVVAHYRADDGTERLACYNHYTDCGELLLSGGACTDDFLLRHMSPAERAALRTVGGVFQYTVAWSMRHFAADFAAMACYTGNTITCKVIATLGWDPTEHPHLWMAWLQPVGAAQRRQMIAKAHSFGAF